MLSGNVYIVYVNFICKGYFMTLLNAGIENKSSQGPCLIENRQPLNVLFSSPFGDPIYIFE